jgi:hypothetical protein
MHVPIFLIIFSHIFFHPYITSRQPHFKFIIASPKSHFTLDLLKGGK